MATEGLRPPTGPRFHRAPYKLSFLCPPKLLNEIWCAWGMHVFSVKIEGNIIPCFLVQWRVGGQNKIIINAQLLSMMLTSKFSWRKGLREKYPWSEMCSLPTCSGKQEFALSRHIALLWCAENWGSQSLLIQSLAPNAVRGCTGLLVIEQPNWGWHTKIRF